MYSIVLATMLTAGGEAPSFCHHYCHSSCYGCSCVCSCYNCYCSGCYGCYTYGCYGGHSCFSCYCSGCYGYCSSCYCSCSSCYGCFGCYSSCYCSGCYGCHSVLVYPSYCSCSCSGGSSGGSSNGGGQATASAGSGLSADELGQIRDLLKKVKDLKTDSASGYDQFVSNLADKNSARLTVEVPQNAELFVNNTRCPLKSETRSFNTPKLEQGKRYYYTLRAEVTRDGQVMQSTKKVYLSAGKHVRVDLRDNMTVVRTAQR